MENIIKGIEVMRQELSSCIDGKYEWQRVYETSLTKFMSANSECSDFVDNMKSIIAECDHNMELAFAAFYVLCTYYRRNKHFSKYSKMFEMEHIESFKNYISYYHLKSMCHIEIFKTKRDYKRAFDDSRIAVEKANKINDNYKMELNSGFYHSFALNVVIGFEEQLLASSSDLEQLKRAEEYMHEVMVTDEYPKYHCTLGRIYMIKVLWEDVETARMLCREAIIEFKAAIDSEDSKQDYALRINEYQLREMKSRNHLEMLNLKERMEEQLKNEVEEIKAKNIEVLSFFVAIMSFVIGSIQIANLGKGFIEKSALIILLFGSLLLVLGAFGKNLACKKGQHYTFSMVTGVIMIVLSLVYYQLS